MNKVPQPALQRRDTNSKAFVWINQCKFLYGTKWVYRFNLYYLPKQCCSRLLITDNPKLCISQFNITQSVSILFDCQIIWKSTCTSNNGRIKYHLIVLVLIAKKSMIWHICGYNNARSYDGITFFLPRYWNNFHPIIFVLMSDVDKELIHLSKEQGARSKDFEI